MTSNESTYEAHKDGRYSGVASCAWLLKLHLLYALAVVLAGSGKQGYSTIATKRE